MSVEYKTGNKYIKFQNKKSFLMSQELLNLEYFWDFNQETGMEQYRKLNWV